MTNIVDIMLSLALMESRGEVITNGGIDSIVLSLAHTIDTLDYEIMVAQYERDIRESFDWEMICADCGMHAEPDPYDDHGLLGQVYLGSILSLYPSGKYWVLWANDNVSSDEQKHDSAYAEALENIANLYGGWIESSDGDPLDLYFCKSYDD